MRRPTRSTMRGCTGRALVEHRMNCLRDLRDIGYQVGCGFMVGSPYQTAAALAADLKFVETFRPRWWASAVHPHHATPFAREPAGLVDLTCYLLSLLRLIDPALLLPATTRWVPSMPTGASVGYAPARTSSCLTFRRPMFDKSTNCMIKGTRRERGGRRAGRASPAHGSDRLPGGDRSRRREALGLGAPWSVSAAYRTTPPRVRGHKRLSLPHEHSSERKGCAPDREGEEKHGDL